MKSAYLLLLSSLVACGGGEESVDDGFECNRNKRSGTYLVEFETISGSCGDQDSAVVQIDAGNSDPGVGCVYNYEEWSKDECDFETNLTCEAPADNLEITLVGKTTQDNKDGSIITGVLNMTIRYLDSGALACSGAYESTAIRQ